MARKRTKKRTHVGANNAPAGKPVSVNQISRAPKSMVIRIGAGEVGPSAEGEEIESIEGLSYHGWTFRSLTSYVILQIREWEYEFENCTHAERTNASFSCRELVMNNFTSPPSENDSANKVPRHLESLTTTIFQSLFPPISPQTTPLSSIRRVMLLNREPTTDGDDGTYTINLRHYAITTKSSGLSKPLRRLNAAEKLLHSQNSAKIKKGGIPNLGKLEDIADYMIGGDGEGYMTDATSGSEVDTDAEVEVVETRMKKILSKRQKDRPKDGKDRGARNGVEKKAIKLVELGPRMKLRMTKVEEGVCTGKIMWHEYIHKTKEEIKAMDKVWEKRRQEKEARKKIQKENVEKKRKAKGVGAKADEDDEEMDYDEWDSEGIPGDGELELNEEMENKGEWEDEEEEIAAG
ncbi:Brix domain-containing [Hyphodiscus hymeniophilus]|uniref:Brix domain-containing n=1 Tax=Hyphodiscus hymeniophilus TaxID=353542 RepID=A0A9P6VL01_9HELO|nr:Brix domain-containing [Hyphodiscus hymeniophilus]